MSTDGLVTAVIEESQRLNESPKPKISHAYRCDWCGIGYDHPPIFSSITGGSYCSKPCRESDVYEDRD